MASWVEQWYATRECVGGTWGMADPSEDWQFSIKVRGADASGRSQEVCRVPTSERRVALGTARKLNAECPVRDATARLICDAPVALTWIALILDQIDAAAANPAGFVRALESMRDVLVPLMRRHCQEPHTHAPIVRDAIKIVAVGRLNGTDKKVHRTTLGEGYPNRPRGSDPEE